MAGNRFNRLCPAPVTSLVLAASYVALQGDWSVASVVTGMLLGLVLPLCASSVISDPRMPRSLSGSLVLIGIVLWDILLANVDVARRVLGPEHVLRPAFIRVPLDVSQPEAIALLASIITLTPGTLSADLAPDQRHLLVHALHAPDTDAVVATIKSRYEARLARLFEDS